MSKVLIETKVLWGLVFPDSTYRSAALRTVQGKETVIPIVCFHELLYPAYRKITDAGKRYKDGMSLISRLSSAYKFLEANYLELFKITSLKIFPLTVPDLIEAYNLIVTHSDLFIKFDKRTETRWPRVVDAVVAAAWKKLSLPLYAEDKELEIFGKREKLEYHDFTRDDVNLMKS